MSHHCATLHCCMHTWGKQNDSDFYRPFSFKSEDWNSKLKSRISDYLFFLNGRGLELLSSFLARTGCQNRFQYESYYGNNCWVFYKSCDVVLWHLFNSEEVTEDEDFIQLLTRIINLLAPLNIKKDSEELIFLKTKYVDVTTSGFQSNLTSGRNSSKSRKQRDGSRKNDYQTKMPINKSYYRPFSSIISDADKQARIYPG